MKTLTQIFNKYAESVELPDGSFDSVGYDDFISAVQYREIVSLEALTVIENMVAENKPRTEIIDRIKKYYKQIKDSQG